MDFDDGHIGWSKAKGEREGSRVLISADDPDLPRTYKYKANMQTFRKLVLQVEHWLDNSFYRRTRLQKHSFREISSSGRFFAGERVD